MTTRRKTEQATDQAKEGQDQLPAQPGQDHPQAALTPRQRRDQAAPPEPEAAREIEPEALPDIDVTVPWLGRPIDVRPETDRVRRINLPAAHVHPLVREAAELAAGALDRCQALANELVQARGALAAARNRHGLAADAAQRAGKRPDRAAFKADLADLAAEIEAIEIELASAQVVADDLVAAVPGHVPPVAGQWRAYLGHHGALVADRLEVAARALAEAQAEAHVLSGLGYLVDRGADVADSGRMFTFSAVGANWRPSDLDREAGHRMPPEEQRQRFERAQAVARGEVPALVERMRELMPPPPAPELPPADPEPTDDQAAEIPADDEIPADVPVEVKW